MQAINKNITLFEKLQGKLLNNEKISLLERDKIKYLFDYAEEVYNQEIEEGGSMELKTSFEEMKSLYTKITGRLDNDNCIEEFELNLDLPVESPTKTEKKMQGIGSFSITGNEPLSHFEEYLELMAEESKGELSDNKGICDLMPLMSKDFLSRKLGLEDQIVRELKKNNFDVSIDKIEEVKTKESEKKIEKEKESLKVGAEGEIEKIFTKSLQKQVNINTSAKSKEDVSKHKEKLDKDIEDEILNEMIHGARNIKNYAKNFNKTFTEDSKKINKIEKTQEVGLNQTTKELKELTTFEKSQRIGFFKLLFMILSVCVSFILMLFVIRVFPKLA